MLTDRTIRQINDQIESELRTVNGSFTSNEDKMAALDRIAKLTAIMNPNTVNVIVPENVPEDDTLTTALSALANRLRK